MDKGLTVYGGNFFGKLKKIGEEAFMQLEMKPKIPAYSYSSNNYSAPVTTSAPTANVYY